MTRRLVATANAVLRALTKAQLMCRGEYPVYVIIQHSNGTKSQKDVLSARFNENSGNVELTVKE